MELILASQSPRRRELLAATGRVFRTVVPGVDETPRPGEAPEAFARRAARDKAMAVADRLPEPVAPRTIIGCDTIVVLEENILGKPRDAAAATDMLRRLSGRSHRVISGLCVIRRFPGLGPEERVASVVTEVDFREVSELEIARYVASGDPMDKAGAYAIQGGAAHMIAAVRGSTTNVIGLPVAELLALL